MSSSWSFESLKKSIGNICAQAGAQSSKHISIPGSISVYPWAWFTSSGFQPKIRYQLLSVTHELVAASNTRLWMHFVPIAVMSPSEANKRTRRLALTRGNILSVTLVFRCVVFNFWIYHILPWSFYCVVSVIGILKNMSPCSEANQKPWMSSLAAWSK